MYQGMYHGKQAHQGLITYTYYTTVQILYNATYIIHGSCIPSADLDSVLQRSFDVGLEKVLVINI